MIAPKRNFGPRGHHEECNYCARRGRHPGRGVAVSGAIVGSAIANSRPVYVEPAPVYVAPPSVYAVPPPYDGPICHVERQQVWDGYAYRTRRVQVCD